VQRRTANIDMVRLCSMELDEPGAVSLTWVAKKHRISRASVCRLMKEADSKRQVELIATQDELIASQDELITTQDELITTQDELITTQDELITTQDERHPVVHLPPLEIAA